MENQMEKVGVSVKKFCSEVMDDLLPPSSAVPVILAYGRSDINKNPILDSHHDLKKKENESQVITSNASVKKESRSSGYCDVNSLPLQSPGNSIQNKLSDSSKRLGVCRCAVGIKRISKNDHPSKDSCQTASLSGDGRSELPSSDTRNSSETAPNDIHVMSSSALDAKISRPLEDFCQTTTLSGDNYRSELASNAARSSSKMAYNDINVMSSSDVDVSGEPKETVKVNTPISDTPIEFPASDKLLPAETLRQRVDDPDFISHASDNNLSAAESVRPEGDSKLTSPSSNKLLSAETVRVNKDDSSCNARASDNKLSAESGRPKGESEFTSSSCWFSVESTGTSMNDSSSVRSKACNLEYEV